MPSADARDGATYEIDLNAKNAAALRKALDKYVAAARTANQSRRARRSRTTTRRPAPRPDIDPKVVRTWADEHRIDVSSRGRSQLPSRPIPISGRSLSPATHPTRVHLL